MFLDCLSVLNIATVLVTLVLAFFLWAKYKQNHWARRGVHSPTAHWLFGHLKDAILLRASPPRVLGDIYKHPSNKDHPVVGVYIFQKPFLLLRNVKLIKQVLIKDFQYFPDRYFASGSKTDIIGRDSLFAIHNPEWKYLRIKLGAAFSSGKQKTLFSLMLEKAENMKRFLEGKLPHDNELVTLDIRGISSRYTTDIISSFTFGLQTDSFLQPDSEFYTRSRDAVRQDFYRTLTLFFQFFFPRLNDFVGDSILEHNTDYFRNAFWESMREREKSGIRRGDVIDILVDLKNEKPDSQFKFQGDSLLAQSVILFLAGLETSATTMSFALKELAQHPEIQQKVRDEIREYIGDENLTYESISKMTYLNQVIAETLRLYPPGPLIDRVAIQNYKIPDTDIVIEKGTVIYVPLNGLHEDPELHPDPLTFDPDRFSEERKKDMEQCSYIPFGDGPRMCIGNRVGAMQTAVGLITILKNYEVSENKSFVNRVSKRAIFSAPDGGMNLYFKKSPVNKS